MENEIDVELEMAQKLLAAAQKRKADAEDAARLAAQAALAKNLADEEARLVRIRREAEENARRWAEKRAAEEQEKRIEEAGKAAETRRLEAEFESRQEAARKEAARQEQVRKVQEAARQMELDAANLEASLRQANTPHEEQKPVTLSSPSHPLSRLFGSGEEVAAQPKEIDSRALALQNSKSQVEPMQSGRKPRPEVDHATSGEIEQMLRKELGLNPSTLALDSLSSRFYHGSLITATRSAIAQFKATPLSSDGLLFLIERYAESPTVGGGN